MTSETEETALDLLPCPFCGGAAEIIDIDEGENEGGSCVSCTKCEASSHLEFGRKENFVSCWNTRAALSRAPEALELGYSTRMTSPASRSQTSLSAGWQEIESNPPPHNKAVLLGWQDTRDGRWISEVAAYSTGQRWDGGFSNQSFHGSASHWMPVPAPPAEEDLSGAQRSELTRLAQDEPVSSPPSTGGAFTGDGFVYHNPDVGTEYAPSHPVESGEVPDATDIRASTQFEDWLVREAAVNRPTSPEMGEISREHAFELISAAYSDGCQAVHDNYQPDPDPEFGEAACDYAESVLSKLKIDEDPSNEPR